MKRNNQSTTSGAVENGGKGTKKAKTAVIKGKIRRAIPTVAKALLFMFAAFCILFPSKSNVSMAVLMLLPDGMKMSGRSNGTVFQKNNVRRNFAMPTYVNNTFTQAVRSFLAYLSSAWNTVLTESQRVSWNNFSLTVSDIFGQPKEIKGKTAFVRMNQNVQKVAPSISAQVLDAPNIENPTPATEFAATATGGGTPVMELSLDDLSGLANVADLKVLIKATAVQSQGTYRPGKSKYRDITIIDAADTDSAVDILAAYEAKFGDAWQSSADKKIFFYAQVVDITTGATSVNTSASAIIA